jgi:hypothetical protein
MKFYTPKNTKLIKKYKRKTSKQKYKNKSTLKKNKSTLKKNKSTIKKTPFSKLSLGSNTIFIV